MLRVVLGLLKGAVVGGALGLGALKLGVGGGAAALLTYAADRRPGRDALRQAAVATGHVLDVRASRDRSGVGVGVGLFWLGRKLLGGIHVSLPASLGAPPDRRSRSCPSLLGPLVGAIWGGFVEIDDGGSAGAAADKNKPKATT